MTEPGSVHVELFVRSLAPCGARRTQERVVEQLLALERAGTVDEVDLTVWGDAVCLDAASVSVGTGADVAETLRAFQRWAGDRGVSLEPYYEHSLVESSLSGETYDRIVPPHRGLAVYVDDRLADLCPVTVDGEPRSVADGVRSLERHGSAAADSPITPADVR